MKNLIIAIAVFGIIVNVSFAQKKELSLSDAVMKSWSSLGPERLKKLDWIPKTNEYIYEGVEDDIKVYFKDNAISDKKEIWYTLSDFNKFLDEGDSLSALPRLHFIDSTSFYFKNDSTYYFIEHYAKKKKRTVFIPKVSADVDVHDKTNKVAYTIDDDLFIKTPEGITIKVSDEEKEGVVFGKAVHRYEFGISKGTFWSPEGNYLAFYKMDESMVSDYPLVDISSKPANHKPIKYPMSGGVSHHVKLGVFNVKSTTITYLDVNGPKDQYLTNISWSPDEKYIYIALLNRGQNHMKLQKYDAISGKMIAVLFEEKDDKYVEPENGPYFINNDPEHFVWFSERDGFQHLYYYDFNGKLIRSLTSGKWMVKKILGSDNEGKYLFVEGTGTDARDNHIYKVDIKRGKHELLTELPGKHKGVLNHNGRYYLHYYSSLKTPLITEVCNSYGENVKTLLKSSNPLSDYNVSKTEFVTIKAKDKTSLYGRIIKPSDFDPGKKYPVLVYVYGGPHVQLVTNKWLGGASLWMHYLAEKGFIIFTLDSRGSFNRGQEFEQATFRNLGKVEIEDQLKGVDYLKSLEYVDSERLGVYGWSFGGYMTTSLMLKAPDVFKIGVAGGPVIDWKYYEIMYTERYMDTPEENPEGYKQTSLLNHVDSLKGKLMIIHGTDDDVVVMQHSLDFLKHCIKKGKQLDFFVYPGHKHNVYGSDRVHLIDKITSYFIDQL